MQLILASQSPRRAQLLQQAGFDFVIEVADIEELRRQDELASVYVQRVALEKAQAVFARLSEERRGSCVVLGADTEVILADRVYGKPVDADDARAMLLSLAGKTHQVLSAVAVVGAQATRVICHYSQVRFGVMNNQLIDAYVDTGEAIGKAGAYAIQGAASNFIEHLEGSFTSVMGLPVFDTVQLLQQFGIEPKWFRRGLNSK